MPRLIVGLTVALVVVPVLLDAATGGPAALFRYSASDAFYYHTVARNIAERGVVSFDGTYPTNGFHPLWQGMLAALYVASTYLPWGEPGYLALVLVTSTGLIGLAVVLIGSAIARGGGRIGPAFLLLPVGAYGLLMLPYWLWAIDVAGLVQWGLGPKPLYGTLWSYVNGMESGVVLLAFALLARTFVARGRAPVAMAALVGLAAAGLTFARLDHALVAVVYPMYYAIEAWRRPDRSRWLQAALCAAALGLPIAVYLAVNIAYAGAPLPISGTAKSTFPIPSLEGFDSIYIALRDPLAVLSMSRLYRAAQLLVPMAVAVWVLWRARRATRPATGYETVLRCTAVGVLLLGGYDFFFVRVFSVGHWYVPVPVLFVSLVVMAPATTPERPPLPLTRTLGFAVAGMLAVVAVFLAAHRRPDTKWIYADFYLREAPLLRAFYGDRPPRIVEYDDGIVAFATGFQAMSALGVMLDVEAAAALEAGRLEELALARGHDRAISLVYFVPETAHGRDPEARGAAAARARLARFEQSRPRLDVTEEFISPSGNVWIARFDVGR